MLLKTSELNFPNPRGFVVLEGVNGAGKSTLQKKLAEALIKLGVDPICTREPGGTKLGLELRALLQEDRVGRLSEVAELLLFGADRAQHVDEIIRSAIHKKRFVISDRYFYSTVAFQGFGRGLNLDLVEQINKSAVRDCFPDLVLLLDLDPNEGLRRNTSLASNKLLKDTFENENIAFHTRIRDGFLKIAQDSQTPFVLINASKEPESVFADSMAAIKKLLEQYCK